MTEDERIEKLEFEVAELRAVCAHAYIAIEATMGASFALSDGFRAALMRQPYDPAQLKAATAKLDAALAAMYPLIWKAEDDDTSETTR